MRFDDDTNTLSVLLLIVVSVFHCNCLSDRHIRTSERAGGARVRRNARVGRHSPDARRSRRCATIARARLVAFADKLVVVIVVVKIIIVIVIID
jgi:hypothetical protein